MINKNVHIIGLQPRQQAALSLVLLNFLMIYTQKGFNDIADNNTLDTIHLKKSSILKAISTFYSILDVLATPSTYSRSKPKVIALSPSAMRSISSALDAYNPANNYLEKYESDLVMAEVKTIDKNVKESLKHPFTEDEIKKAGIK